MIYMINKTPIYRWQPATGMAIWHIILMALSPDLSGGERKSHQLSDTKIVLPWHCLTLLHPAIRLSAVICSFTKTAYFPGEKITRTQMLNRVSAKWFTWLINQSCIGVSSHKKERSRIKHTPVYGWGFFSTTCCGVEEEAEQILVASWYHHPSIPSSRQKWE